MKAQHIVNISGGKDSAACALLAADRGKEFRLVMADTGNESPITVEYAHKVADFVGKPLEIARADFTDRLAGKRDFVARVWPTHGVPQDRVDRALAILVPTGNPFVDLCLWKGRFPSRKAQFCTEFLKSEAVWNSIVEPALEVSQVIQWLGVRRDESLNRRNAPMFQRVRQPKSSHDMMLYRPIIHWTAQNVFSFAASRGLPPNPLYLQGMGRVGCFPCINASKDELRAIGRRFPEAFDKIAEWECLVAEASKRGNATFFSPDVTPEGAALGKMIKAIPDPEDRRLASAAAPWPNARTVAEWARTDRGGKQFNLLEYTFAADEGLSCSSQYGLCE